MRTSLHHLHHTNLELPPPSSSAIASLILPPPVSDHLLRPSKRLRLLHLPSPAASAEPCSFDSIPDDLLLSIISSLASSATSASDLINASLACKRFYTAGAHPSILAVVASPALAVKAAAWCDGARRFLQRCADVGNAEAAYILGMISFYCFNERQAGASLMAQAALKARHAEALYSLAIIHFNGSGSGSGSRRDEKSLRCGAVLCAKAAAEGHVGAMKELGHCLQDGYGVEKNEEEGKRLLQKAREKETAEALARMKGSGSVERAAAALKAVKDCRGGCRCAELSVHHGHMVAIRQLMLNTKVLMMAAPPFSGFNHSANRFLVEWFAAHPPFSDASEPLALCCNAGCGRSETRLHEFRRCSACCSAQYCSRSCQSMDWSASHKLHCFHTRRLPPHGHPS